MPYAIYLRKSRADAEAEAHGEGETLARHETQLLELARKKNLSIGVIYKELVSGDTIAARPEMQKLLEAVSDGAFEGVLVMEIERLARGDTMDQGLVAQTFKYSGTKIITPSKTYDPENEFDEEYFEFSLFMSRREYKTIRRRMQAGRLASVKEGNYIGSIAPYGYRKVRDYDARAFTLEIIPEQADTVRMMYDMYIHHDMGFSKIANALNNMHIPPPKTDIWTASSTRAIIENPLYCGKIRWDWRKVQKKLVDGRLTTTRPKTEGAIYDGKHPPIVTEDVYEEAKKIMSAKFHTSSFYGRPLQNPFAGVLFCKFCGHAIVRRPYPGNQPAHYICNRSGCPCRSTSDIEFHEVFIAALKDQLQSVNAMVVSGTDFDNDTDGLRDKLSRELDKLKKQQDSLCDLLEQGIYTPQIFTERSAKIAERIKSISDTLNELPTRPQKSPREIAVALEQVVDIFMSESDATAKNALLKKIVRRIEYSKTTGGRWEKSDMAIEIFLNV